jgi:hypothetical protein
LWLEESTREGSTATKSSMPSSPTTGKIHRFRRHQSSSSDLDHTFEFLVPPSTPRHPHLLPCPCLTISP